MVASRPPAPFPVEWQACLGPYTTLELGGPARALSVAHSESELLLQLTWARSQGWPVLLLGGGSNLVISDDGFDGLAVRVRLTGLQIDRSSGRVWAAAGEPWDAVVARTVDAELSGFECLSGIPGSIGATPVQNVGAYGREVSEFVEQVRAVDISSGQLKDFRAEDCDFGYRDSRFKRESPRWAILSVAFRLDPGRPPALRYPELKAAFPSGVPSLAQVRQRVLSIRRSKSMVIEAHDVNRRSVGSFFTNPVVDATAKEVVIGRALRRGLVSQPKEVPVFPVGPYLFKLSAAWLIERSGVHKGLRRGGVGVSSRHALALVHHGGSTTHDLLGLARDVQARVFGRFGVRLEPEPTLVGCHLKGP